MRRRDDRLGRWTYEVVWSAAALNVVTLLAILAAAILFAVDDLAALGWIARAFSVLIWGGAEVVLVGAELARQVRAYVAAGEEPRGAPLDD